MFVRAVVRSECKANIPDLQIIEKISLWRTLSACINLERSLKNFECFANRIKNTNRIKNRMEIHVGVGSHTKNVANSISDNRNTPTRRHLQLIHPFLMLHLISRQKTKEHSRKNVVHQFIYFVDSLFVYLERYFKLLIYEHPSIQPEVLYSLIIYFWLHHDCFLIHSAPVDIYFHFAGQKWLRLRNV